MKRLLLLIAILAGCVSGAFAQNRISDFKTLIDIKGKSETIEFVKSGDNVKEIRKFKSGSEPQEFTEPVWNTVYRIVVDDYKKIHTAVINFDAMLFYTFGHETIQ